jgi:D-alanyl-D-alanine carboxypeptidase/D-alanyl-D-alanine-endopeptidase (penicillin-binding protein 4)
LRTGWTARRTALLAGGAAVVLAAGTGAALTLQSRPGQVPARPVPSPAASWAPVLTAAGTAAPAPSTAGLAKALGKSLHDPALGRHVAVSVLDAVTGRPLLETSATSVVLPASTAKIATAVAALTVLPPDRQLTTRVVAGPAPGEVVLVGGGDPTLAGPLTRPGYPVAARLADLAEQVRAALAGTPLRRVLVDDSLYTGPVLGPGWRPSYVTGGDVAPVTALMVDEGRTALPPLVGPSRAPRQGDPALAAGRSLARLLGAPAVPVTRGRAVPGATELGAVDSPTVRQLVEQMLTHSDNDLAEALSRQVALAKGRPASFEGAATAVRSVLRELLPTVGAGPGSVLLQDGSGLSRLDRVQPAAITRLLSAVAGARRAQLFPMLSGLPVAGFDGTLERRYRKGPQVAAAGVVRAKTGTLNGVSALAGLVRTHDGRLLAFDITADAVPLPQMTASQAALDRVAAALAACGCR